MGPGAYLVGCALVLVVVGALAWGAASVRAWLLPRWFGVPARLAEVVVAVSIAIVVSEVLGAFGGFRRVPVAACLVGVACVLGQLGRRFRPRDVARSNTARGRPSRLDEIVAASVAVALVSAQWAGEVAATFDKGMTHWDTTWYHGPYVALFVQRGHLLELLDRTDALHAFAGQTSELFHAVFALLLGCDVLSPLVNVGWSAVALLAAWCIGRRHGVGALCVLATALVLGLPVVTATQPGQGSNDVTAGAFLLVTIALLLESDLAIVPVGCAALAAGLALSTKLTTSAPVAVLTVGVVVIALRRRRPRVALTWCAALAATGSYWFLRNVKVAHNPVPYYTIHLGPFTWSGGSEGNAGAVARYLFNSKVWQRFFVPGLHRELGVGWQLVVLLALLGTILVVFEPHFAFERLVAVALIAGLIAYLFTPYTAAAGGLTFSFNMRYVVPPLLGAIAIFPLAIARERAWWRRAAWIVMVAVVLTTATARHYERVAAWPADGRAVAITAGVLILAGALSGRAVLERIGTRVVGASVLTLVMIVTLGWIVERHYLHDRYVAAGLPLDAVYGAIHDVHHERIAVFGTGETYPFYGTDLTNVVIRPVAPAVARSQLCRAWIELLGAERVRYVVLAHAFFVEPGPPDAWIAPDHGIAKVVGTSDGTLYRVLGPLRGDGCAPN